MANELDCIPGIIQCGDDAALRRFLLKLQVPNMPFQWPQGFTGPSPLHLAAYYGHGSMVEMLIQDFKFDADSVSSMPFHRLQNVNALQFALYGTRNICCMRLLMENGADPDLMGLVDEEVMSPMEWCHKYNYSIMADTLNEYRVLKKKNPALYSWTFKRPIWMKDNGRGAFDELEVTCVAETESRKEISEMERRSPELGRSLEVSEERLLDLIQRKSTTFASGAVGKKKLSPVIKDNNKEMATEMEDTKANISRLNQTSINLAQYLQYYGQEIHVPHSHSPTELTRSTWLPVSTRPLNLMYPAEPTCSQTNLIHNQQEPICLSKVQNHQTDASQHSTDESKRRNDDIRELCAKMRELMTAHTPLMSLCSHIHTCGVEWDRIDTARHVLQELMLTLRNKPDMLPCVHRALELLKNFGESLRAERHFQMAQARSVAVRDCRKEDNLSNYKNNSALDKGKTVIEPTLTTKYEALRTLEETLTHLLALMQTEYQRVRQEEFEVWKTRCNLDQLHPGQDPVSQEVREGYERIIRSSHQLLDSPDKNQEPTLNTTLCQTESLIVYEDDMGLKGNTVNEEYESFMRSRSRKLFDSNEDKKKPKLDILVSKTESLTMLEDETGLKDNSVQDGYEKIIKITHKLDDKNNDNVESQLDILVNKTESLTDNNLQEKKSYDCQGNSKMQFVEIDLNSDSDELSEDEQLPIYEPSEDHGALCIGAKCAFMENAVMENKGEEIVADKKVAEKHYDVLCSGVKYKLLEDALQDDKREHETLEMNMAEHQVDSTCGPLNLNLLLSAIKDLDGEEDASEET